MATLTVSTTGIGLSPSGAPASEAPECHQVESIRYVRYCGNHETDRNVATIAITPEAAYQLAADLLYQAVDGGVITGWSVSFPEHGDA